MFLPYQVNWVAETFLRQLLSNYPSQLRACLEYERFPVWCRLCAERLNQLDLAGFVKSKAAAEHFIRVAVLSYARHQIKKEGLKIPSNTSA